MTRGEFDRQFLKEGIRLVAGVDEAGRGPLAGAVFAAAVIFPADFYMEEINDSKALSAKQRERLFPVIQQRALAWSIARVDEGTVDEINILNAAMLAMRRAVEALAVRPELLLVDGNVARGLQEPCLCVKKGDSLSQSIAAASILAKVARDAYCREELAVQYPLYEFEKHKGYGTRRHYELLRAFGPCPAHRQSFLRKFFQQEAGR